MIQFIGLQADQFDRPDLVRSEAPPATAPSSLIGHQLPDLEAARERVLRPRPAAARVGEPLRSSLEAKIIALQDRNAVEREFFIRKLAKLETEPRGLLDAYYAGAIDVDLLRAEQSADQ